MVFDVTFNNISVITWQSVLLVEETAVPRENHRPVASHWQTLLCGNTGTCMGSDAWKWMKNCKMSCNWTYYKSYVLNCDVNTGYMYMYAVEILILTFGAAMYEKGWKTTKCLLLELIIDINHVRYLNVMSTSFIKITNKTGWYIDIYYEFSLLHIFSLVIQPWMSAYIRKTDRVYMYVFGLPHLGPKKQ